MSINVGQIFIRHDNLNLLLRVTAEYMRVWQKGVFSRLSTLEKEEQGAENFLSRRARRMSILPPKDGWAMIIEQVRFLADGDLARHISESLACRVIWTELQGGALGWACFEFEKGRLVRGRLEPPAGREERLIAAATEAKAVNLSQTESADMPLYPLDPEKQAWDYLVQLGLPPEYVFMYPGDVGRLGKAGEFEAGFVILRDSHYGGRMTAAIGPAKLLARPAALPYRPDLVARDVDQPKAIHEVRLLHGRPTRPAIERVFAAELNWRRRAFYTMSNTLTGRVPEISFKYKDPADPDRDFDEILEKHRDACKSPFIALTSSADVLARKGFAARAAELINAEDGTLEAAPDEGGNLTVKLGGEEATLDLLGSYRRYVADTSVIEETASEALAAFRSRHALVAELSSSDRNRLLLVLRGTDTLPLDSVSTEVAEGVDAVLAVEKDDAVVELPKAALKALDLDKSAAVDAAREHLSSLAGAAQTTVGVGSISRVEVGPPLPAASLLAWPGLANKLAETTDGELAVAVPASGVMLFTPLESAGSPEFRAAVNEEFDLATDPVSESVFKLTQDGLELI